ncbi:gamma-glutamyl-gamma-aminobutyrate hydrolase family protein [Aureimonas jatrophae]|uniref:gamma-glutamyl-gamma-aminobutyrate hydrolase n=1 Tax=Aureimonas jatrophae TaxID=1166073 RepID=A0A1H0J773_9HYPH|nr:gamma-glutamyl-gamma-aminobutyrate hydrolase family protein [Aureimonas jatrophae]MBB3951563.1 putative glutamine amidotransferase [Aureimonas jatrophae]SDO39452.1 putative glutamine amidotransferase [Aureimonas jatrophae]
MTTNGLLIAVPADTRQFESYLWHAAPSTYLDALARIGALPVIVPALDGVDLDPALDRVDGVLLTGSASNVHPERYGEAPTPGHEPYDTRRDALTARLIEGALSRGLPLLAICRGHQELNVALGGSLGTEIQEIEGRMDHRAPVHPEQDQRFALRHPVRLTNGGRLATLLGTDEVEVNSLHRQAVRDLAPRLSVEASAPDGTVEAVSVRDAPGFAFGVQWHPEYWSGSDGPSKRLFEAFADACRAYRDLKA